jgi:elongation factor Ts
MSELMDNIKNLREMTGAGFLDCKKALEENNNNVENSIDYLRKKGLAKASKKSSREVKEGAVGIYSNQTISAIIQINTETDFAAKNEVFLNFMDQIGQYVLDVNKPDLSLDNFNQMVFNKFTINDIFKDIISKIGENIVLTKLIILENSENALMSKYIHNTYRKNVGKIAVLLKSKVEKINEESKLLGKNLCMHIAACKPLAMDIDNLDKNLIEKEKEVQLETIKAIGKPDNIIKKILDGKMNKFYSESTFLNQQFILDSDKTISQILSEFSKNNKFDIMNYQLVVLGF